MRAQWTTIAALALLAGCAQVSGLDAFCPLEQGAPFDAPCRLVAPVCGCPEGETCRLDRDGQRECERPSRTLTDPGEDCSRTADCVPGAACSAGICRSYCEFREDCASMGPNSRCFSTGGLGVCTRSCRPQSADCGPGFKCGTIDGGTLCLAAGAGALGESCTDTEACAIGLQCAASNASEPFTCKLICGFDLPDCPGGQTCQRVERDGPLSDTEYGVCGL